MQTLRVYRPRVITHDPIGMGQATERVWAEG